MKIGKPISTPINELVYQLIWKSIWRMIVELISKALYFNVSIGVNSVNINIQYENR
jgi:hypothetical protein